MTRRTPPMARCLFALCALLLLTSSPLASHAEINMWEDEEGVLIFDSRRAPREDDGVRVAEDEIQTKPLPEGLDVAEFRRIYERGTSVIGELAEDYRNARFDPESRIDLVPFKNYLNIKSPGLEIPPGVQHRIDSLEGVARVSQNMTEGQRDQEAVDRLRSKAAFCDALASKLRWDVWIKTYEAPIDIAELDESICLDR